MLYLNSGEVLKSGQKFKTFRPPPENVTIEVIYSKSKNIFKLDLPYFF